MSVEFQDSSLKKESIMDIVALKMLWCKIEHEPITAIWSQLFLVMYGYINIMHLGVQTSSINFIATSEVILLYMCRPQLQ